MGLFDLIFEYIQMIKIITFPGSY